MKQVNHRKILLLSLLFILLGVIVSLVIRKTLVTTTTVDIQKLVLPIVDQLEISQIRESAKHLPSNTLSNTVQEHFFKINLAVPDLDTLKALEWLKAGLRSNDTSVRLASAALVRTILIDVGHQNVVVNSNIKTALDSIFLLFKEYGKEVLDEMQDTNPNSPALKYLKNVKS